MGDVRKRDGSVSSSSLLASSAPVSTSTTGSSSKEERAHLDTYGVFGKTGFTLAASAAGFAARILKGRQAGEAVKALVGHDMKLADPIQSYLRDAARHSETPDPMANMVMAARSLSQLPSLLAGPNDGCNHLAHVVATLKDFLDQAEFVFGDLDRPPTAPEEPQRRMQALLAARHQFCVEKQVDPISMDTAAQWSQNFPGHADSILAIAINLLGPKSLIGWPKGYTPYTGPEISAALHIVAGYRDPVFSFLGMGSEQPAEGKLGVAVAQSDIQRLQTLTPGHGATALCCNALELAMKTVQSGHPHAGELLRPEVRLLTDLEALQALHADPATVTPEQRKIGLAWLKQSADVLGKKPGYEALCAQNKVMNESESALSMLPMLESAKVAAKLAYLAYNKGNATADEPALFEAMQEASTAFRTVEEAPGIATQAFVVAYQALAREFANALAGAIIKDPPHPEIKELGIAVGSARDIPTVVAELRAKASDSDSLLWLPARRNIAGRSGGSVGLGKELLSLMMWNEAVLQAAPGNTITTTDMRWKDAQQHAWLQQAALQLRDPEQAKVQKNIKTLYSDKKPSDSDIKKRSEKANALILGLKGSHPEFPHFTVSSIALDMEDANTASDLARAMMNNHMFEHKQEGMEPRAKLPHRGHNALAIVARLCIAEVVMARTFAKAKSESVV